MAHDTFHAGELTAVIGDIATRAVYRTRCSREEVLKEYLAEITSKKAA